MISTNIKEEIINASEIYEALHTIPVENFDDVSLIASQICDAKIAIIIFIDNNKPWIMSAIGVETIECITQKFLNNKIINKTNKFITIEDTRENEIFIKNPLIIEDNEIRFYTSTPIFTPEGIAIGAICVLDKKTKKTSSKQKRSLKTLSNQVTNFLKLNKNEELLDKNNEILENKNQALESFTDESVSDMRSPLNTITLLSEMIKNSYSDKLNSKAIDYLTLIKNSSNKMIRMVNDVKEFHDNLDLIANTKEFFFINDLFSKIIKANSNVKINFTDFTTKIFANKEALRKILEVKITDLALQNKQENYKIELDFKANKNSYLFSIIDNGNSPVKEKEEKCFDCKSIGKILIHSLGGNITTNYIKETGNVIKFNIPK